jgi:multiple antibiotic resistance protein
MEVQLKFKEIISVSLILFAVIDILGSVPIIIGLKEKTGKLESLKATVVAGIIMILFLFLGDSILQLIGIDVFSFAIAGAIIIFILAMEMILGVEFFKEDHSSNSSSIVPIAFPLIAGAGTLTTILSLRAEYKTENILVGIVLNLIFVFFVLELTPWIQRVVGRAGTNILRKVFGIILLAIAIKLFTSNIGLYN